MTSANTTGDWVDEIAATLRELEIRQVGYVPDAGHSRLIRWCSTQSDLHTVSLTTEEEGVALAAGAWLGGQRCALLMQSSGVGNCINMLAMTRECRFPLLMLVTMRGQWREFNPWQVPMGQASAEVLRAMGVTVYEPQDAGEIASTVAGAGHQAFSGCRAAAVFIAQHIIGAKTWGSDE